jgi:predicted metal-binding protein
VINTIKFYAFKETSMIICEECRQEDIDKTRRGELAGNEVYPHMLQLVEDWQTEAYQCDSCLTQNEAYEEMGNPDIDEG